MFRDLAVFFSIGLLVYSTLKQFLRLKKDSSDESMANQKIRAVLLYRCIPLQLLLAALFLVAYFVQEKEKAIQFLSYVIVSLLILLAWKYAKVRKLKELEKIAKCEE